MKTTSRLLVSAALCSAFSAASTAMEVGVCAHVGNDEFAVHEREFPLMRDAGFTRVRADFSWAEIEPAPGDWRFGRFDRIVADADANGLRILPIFDYDNPRAYPDYAWEHLDAWCRFVRTVVERYRTHFDVVEIWNEPNLPFAWKPRPDVARYTELLKATYAVVKEAAPEIRVMMAGTAGADTFFLEGIYQAGGGPCMDIVNIHPYSWPNPPDGVLEKAIAKTREVMARHGDADKPLWITEHGWPTHKLQVAGSNALLAGLSLARPERSSWRIVYASLGDPAADGGFVAKFADILPAGSTAEAWAPERLAAELSPATADAVLLPRERFPLDALDSLLAFVRDGGVLVAIGGVPMYYASRGGEDVEGVDCNEVKRSFHLGWHAWWTDSDLPDWLATFATPEAVAHGYRPDPAGYRVERFFTGANLAPGDRMVPLLAGTDKAGRTVYGAAVYLLDSDLKGAIVVSSADMANGGSTEEDQAKYLVRSIEIARELGVEAYFPYEFMAPEGDPLYSEANFGIVHRDLSPKPAYEAIKALLRGQDAPGLRGQ